MITLHWDTLIAGAALMFAIGALLAMRSLSQNLIGAKQS